MSTHWDQIRATLARRFFAATVLQAGLGVLLATLLILWSGPPVPGPELRLPVAFQFATFCLVAGSLLLQQAIGSVRLERQAAFRRSLLTALVMAILFVGIQSAGLWGFMHSVSNVRDTQTNVHGFVFMFAALHAMHFLIAQSVLLWVTLCAFADRYDHEYYWGVVFAAWCWHVLGIVWVAILCVFAIVT